MKYISINEENHGELFWRAVEAKAEEGGFYARKLTKIEIDRPHYTSHEKAASIERWCESIPGWNGGPAHAPHPVRFDAA